MGPIAQADRPRARRAEITCVLVPSLVDDGAVDLQARLEVASAAGEPLGRIRSQGDTEARSIADGEKPHAVIDRHALAQHCYRRIGRRRIAPKMGRQLLDHEG